MAHPSVAQGFGSGWWMGAAAAALVAVTLASPGAAAASEPTIRDVWPFEPLTLRQDPRPIASIKSHTSSALAGPDGASRAMTPPVWTEHRFDRQGRLVELRRLNEAGAALRWWAVEYDPQGRMLRVTEHALGSPQFYEHATYNRRDELERLERRRATGNRGYLGEVVVDHRRQGAQRMTAYEPRLDDGQAPQITMLTYDRQGRLVERLMMDPNRQPVQRDIYRRSRDGRIESRLVSVPAGTGWRTIAKHDYTYESDEQGNWTKRVIKRFYDDKGRLVEGSVDTTVREITYHEPEGESEGEPASQPTTRPAG